MNHAPDSDGFSIQKGMSLFSRRTLWKNAHVSLGMEIRAMAKAERIVERRKKMRTNDIDHERLRKDLYEDSLGAGFGGGFGGAFLEAEDIRSASDEKLEKIAHSRGIDLSDYNPGK